MSQNGQQTELAHIPLKLIRESEVALRSVDKESESYLNLVDSIRKNGVLNPILVRQLANPQDPSQYIYGLIDGLQRFTASGDAGKETIPAQITTMAQGDLLEAQILANIHRVETKPSQYTEQLRRIMSMNPLLTMSELASRLSKSVTWLTERLNLVKLDPKIAELVDEGKITLTNGYTLAKLPIEHQMNFVEQAQTMQPGQFIPTVQKVAKELRDAVREGRKANPLTFQPVAHLRKLVQIKDEISNPRFGPELLSRLDIKSPQEAFTLGLNWVLHMDPMSQQTQRDEDAKKRASLEAEKAARKAEREAKRQKEAEENAAALVV